MTERLSSLPVARILAGADVNGYLGFIGVSTTESSIMKIFPTWAEILNLPTRTLIGHDLPMDAPAAQYRDLLVEIRDDPRHLGALVTTHKMALFAAASDLFDELDEFSTLCGEVSSISKRDRRLIGHAKDPITVALAANEFLPPGHFARSGAQAICLGAGGAGTALTWALAERTDAPAAIIVTDTSQRRLDHLREVHRRRGTPESLVRYVLATGPDVSSALVGAAPSGSLIVNASGLGKDRPGSPLPDEAVFPRRALVWEFNYRGSLEFLAQANRQRESADLVVVDGWRYFIHGWSQVIAEVFGLTLTDAVVAKLSESALAIR